MEILYPLIVGAVIVLGLYASGALSRLGLQISSPGRQDNLLTLYTALTRAALEVRHALDDAAHRGSSLEDRERLQRSVTRLQVALQPMLEAASDASDREPDITRDSGATSPMDFAIPRGLQAAAVEVQRSLHATNLGHPHDDDRERIRAALHRMEETIVPLAVEPFARDVALAAEAFYQDCSREAAALDDPFRELQSQLVGTSYLHLFEAVQESSAQLQNSTTDRPRHLPKG